MYFIDEIHFSIENIQQLLKFNEKFTFRIKYLIKFV